MTWLKYIFFGAAFGIFAENHQHFTNPSTHSKRLTLLLARGMGGGMG